MRGMLVRAMIVLMAGPPGTPAMAQVKEFDFGVMRDQQFTAAPMIGSANRDEESREPIYVDELYGVGVRVTGGTEILKVTGGTATESLPETVRIDVNDATYCTGVLIDWRTILTAGHCACEAMGSYKISVTARVGLREENFPRRLVSPPITFPNYDCDRRHLAQPALDLALLKMEDPFEAGSRMMSSEELGERWNYAPPAIAPMHTVFYDQKTIALAVVGYGRTETGELSNGRRIAFVNVLSYFCSGTEWIRPRCAAFREFVLSNVFPVGGSPIGDSCQGDSGGPVFYFPPGASGTNTRHLLVGVTSRGLPGAVNLATVPCGGGGIYTAIGRPDVLAWLTRNDVNFDYATQ